jgi:hypothetical protein
MSAELVPFVLDGRKLRHVLIDGIPWFFAKDLCALLGYKNARKAVADHVDSEDRNTVTSGYSNRGNPRTLVVNESGMWALILRSTLQEAKRVKHWVTHEVLPTIRKTGQYSIAIPAITETWKRWEHIFSEPFRRHLFRLLEIPFTSTGKTPLRVGRAYWDLFYNRLGSGVPESLRKVNPRRPGRPWRCRKNHQHIAVGFPTEHLRIMAAQCEAVMGCYAAWPAFIARWNEIYPPIQSLPQGIKAELADGRQLFFTFSIK